MKLRTTEELWILDGEIGPPWFKFRDGSGALGLAAGEDKPTPIRIPKGSIIYVDLPERPHDKQTRVPVSGRGMDTVHLPARVGFLPECTMGCDNMMLPSGAHQEGCDVYKFLAEMGHKRKQDLFCGCTCKGCGSGGHCYDHRCYPLPVKRFGELGE